MKIENKEIASVALCTEGAVRAAVGSKRLDPSSLSSVLSFCLTGRLKGLGIEFMDELSNVSLGSELHYDPDGSQEEGEW